MKKLIFSLLCFVVLSTQAATYYISPMGNDATGNGSARAPWKTLFKATASVTGAGNIIHVNAGTYVETQICNLAPGVSIEGDGTGSIIKASFSTVYWMIIQANSPEGTNGNQSISKLKFDGQNNTSWAIQIQGRSNVEIHDCTIINFKQRGIVWGGRADNSDNPPSTYATGNKCYNNIITNCGGFDGTYGYGCLNIGGQDGMLIYGNNITTTGTNPGWPIKLWNDGYLKGCKIYDNILKRPAYPYQYNGINNYFDFCIELFHQWGIEIYNNTIEGSIDLNWQLKGNYDYSAYIHDNIIGRDFPAAHCETGIWLEFESEDVIIENNKFKHTSQPIMFSLRPGNYTNNITIRKNLGYGIGKADGTKQGSGIGIIVNDDSQNYTARDWSISNNSFFSIGGNNRPWFGIDIPSGNSATNIKFDNNIVVGFETGMQSQRSSKINGLTIKNNILFNNGNNAVQFSGGTPVNYTNSGNINSDPNLNGLYEPLGPPSRKGGTDGTDIGYTGGGSIPPPPEPCSYVYSDYGPCINGQRTRTVISAFPGGCVGTPVLTETCTPPPVPCVFVYSDWSACDASGMQRRTVISQSPAGCYGEPDLIRTCTPPPVKTFLFTIWVYTDNTISKSKKQSSTKTLLTSINVYSDGSIIQNPK